MNIWLQNKITYRTRAIENDEPDDLIITAEEKMKVRKAFFRSIQQESFKEKKQFHLQKLNPFLDVDRLLRARCRTMKSKDMTFAQKHPIKLDGNYHNTSILLRNEDLENHNVGIEQLRSMVQENYSRAFFGVRNQLRSIKSNFGLCRKNFRKSENPVMADLPEVRKDFSRTFENTGVDYFGPFNVKVRRKSDKR